MKVKVREKVLPKSPPKSAASKIWEFMNNSQILSAVIISVTALIGTQIVKFYTYIYWMPYFTFFKIPLKYYNVAILDDYSLIVEVLPQSFSVLFFAFIFQKGSDKFHIEEKLGLPKAILLAVLLILSFCVIQTVLARRNILPLWLASLPRFIRIDIWGYFADALLLLCLKRWVQIFWSGIRNRTKSINLIPIIIILVIIAMCFVGLWVYIRGYNDNTVTFLVGELETIDDDKLILFETSDQYYIIPCEKNEDGSLKIYMNYYAFVDKDKQLVHRDYYNDIYNSYGIKIN